MDNQDFTQEAKDTKTLQMMLQQRKEIYEQEKDLTSRKDRLITALREYMETNNFTGVNDDNFGSVIRVEGSRSKLDQQRLKLELINKGVDPTVVGEAFNVASSSSDYVSLKYMYPGEK